MALAATTPNEIPEGSSSGAGQGFAQQTSEDISTIPIVFGVDAMIPGVTKESKGIFPLAVGALVTAIPFGGVTNAYFVHLQIRDQLSKKYLPVLVTLNSIILVANFGELLLTVPEPAAVPLTGISVTGHATRAVDVTYHFAGT